MERRYTKRPLIITTVRLAEQDRRGIFLAAQRAGEAQSEFIRLAVRERIERVLAAK